MEPKPKPKNRAITLSLPINSLKVAQGIAKQERRSLSAQVAVWIDENTKKGGK